MTPLSLAWHAFNLNTHFLRNRKIAADVRDTVFQVTIVARLLYGAQNWVLAKEDLQALRKAHNRMVSSMIRLPFKEWRRVPHAEIRARFANTPCVEDLLRRRQLRYAGHLLRMHERQPRLPSIALTGRLDPEVHPRPAYLEKEEEGAWAKQLKQQINTPSGSAATLAMYI